MWLNGMMRCQCTEFVSIAFQWTVKWMTDRGIRLFLKSDAVFLSTCKDTDRMLATEKISDSRWSTLVTYV